MRPQSQRLGFLLIDVILMNLSIYLAGYRGTNIIQGIPVLFAIIIAIFALTSGFTLIRGYIRHYRRNGELI